MRDTSGKTKAESLLKHGFGKQDIDEICRLVTLRRSPGNDETLNFRVLHDAGILAELKEAIDNGKADIDMDRLVGTVHKKRQSPCATA